MKGKKMYGILLLSCLLILLAGTIQQTQAAVRIVEIQVPSCA